MPSVTELTRQLQQATTTIKDLEVKLDNRDETLKERVGRIEEIKLELDAIEDQLDAYKNASLENADDVGKTALHELQTLAELDGPFVALAYAHTVFEQLQGLIDPEEGLAADRLSPFPSEVKEYRARAHRHEATIRRRAS